MLPGSFGLKFFELHMELELLKDRGSNIRQKTSFLGERDVFEICSELNGALLIEGLLSVQILPTQDNELTRCLISACRTWRQHYLRTDTWWLFGMNLATTCDDRNKHPRTFKDPQLLRCSDCQRLSNKHIRRLPANPHFLNRQPAATLPACDPSPNM